MKKIFFSYSKHDREMLEQLLKHLSLLTNQGIIAPWSDHDILPGEEWDDEIKKNLAFADIILLLVSSDFLATEYIWKVEITKAMERHEKKEARVIPVILRPCHWESAPFGKLNGLPLKGKPVTSYENRDEAWLQVVIGINKVLEASKTPIKQNQGSESIGVSSADRGTPSTFNIGNIYKLIDSVFDDTDLQTFCMINFEKVHSRFASGQNKKQRVLELIDYTKRQLEFEKLLALIQEENPQQYENFKPYL